MDLVIAKHATKKNTYTYTYNSTKPIELIGNDGSGDRVRVIEIPGGVNWEFENTIWTINGTGLIIAEYLSTGKPLRDLIEPEEQLYSMSGRYGAQYNSSWIRSHSSCKPSETYQ